MRKYSLWFLSLAILATPAIALFLYVQVFAPHTPPVPVQIEVSAGSSLDRVARVLQKRGVIRNYLAIKLLARWQQQGGKIQTGHYRFSDPATPGKVLNRLIRGDVEKVSLTIPEGFTLQQIIDRTAVKGFGEKEKLVELTHDTEFIHSLGIDADSLEGYLFPETYLFVPGIDEKTLLRMMVKELRRHATTMLIEKAKKIGLNLHQWLTLASIIEKETGIVEEMATISAVFHNRLKRNIPLQTDPTVIYGIKDFDGNLTRKHLTTPTPYNTYLKRGLPPGPIASPGLAALKAAAYPSDSKFLYFVANGKGGHYFSKTLKEHNAAVRKYQLHH